MEQPNYYTARVFTADHTQIADLPMYAATVLVLLTEHDPEKDSSRAVQLATECFRRYFQIRERTIDIDQVTKAGGHFGSLPDWRVENELGKAGVAEELHGGKHPQSRQAI